MPSILAISVSDRKGVRKNNIKSAKLIKNFGIENDAHGGKWHRQISLLAQESIDFMREKGLDVVAGNFAENITTTGIDLPNLNVGDHLRIGKTELIISQLGKICHNRCAIYHQAGDCVMPREGIFGIVKKEGIISVDDELEILAKKSTSSAIICTSVDIARELEEKLGIINTNLKSSFTRIDSLNKDKDNLATILLDLELTQKVTSIFFYDPTGKSKDLYDLTSRPINMKYAREMEDLK